MSEDKKKPQKPQQSQKSQAKAKRQKTQVEDVGRGVYDIKDAVHFREKTERGLNESIIRRIFGDQRRARVDA